MKIQTVNQLISVFKDIATRHYQINGFGIGDSWEIGASEAKMHPVLWINPVTATMPETDYGYKTFEIDFEVRVFDLVNKDESNENDVLSDTIDIIKDIITEFKGHPYYVASELNIVNDISFEAFTEEFDEEVSGWLCEISLMTPILTTFCGLPMAEITGFEFPGSDCPTVNTLCPVFIDEIVGTYPIIVDAFGTTRTISIDTDALVDTYMISQDFNSGSDNILTTTLNNGTSFDTLIDNFNTITINGTINSNNPDTGIILNSFNTSTGGDLSQFVIEHISGGVTIRNDRDLPIILNPDGKTTIGAINSLGCAEITLAKDTIVSGEFVQHVSTTPTADACLIDNSISFHMDGSALAGQYKDNLGTVTPIEFGATVDVLGIADSNGVYTYYSDYASAITAASVGGTIEQFGDIVETGSVTLNITKSLTIQMNGYSYTLDNVDGTYAVEITGNDLNINILNGKINRINGVASRTIDCGTSITNRSIICFDGTTIFTDLDDTHSLLTTTNNTTITGGVWRSESGGGNLSVIVDTDCTLTNFIYEGTGYVSSFRSRSMVSNGTINSSHPSQAFNLNGGDCKGNNLTIRNTVGEGVYSVGTLTNCNVYSEGNDAIRMAGTAVTDNCYGYSTGGAGIYVSGGVVSNSQGYSTSTFGMLFDGRNSPKGINCKALSSVAAGIWLFAGSNGVTLINCYAESTLNTTAGHAINCNTAPSNLKIINCTVKTANAGANGISAGGSGYVKGLSGIGMTKLINAGFTNLQVRTTDAYGNGLIG